MTRVFGTPVSWPHWFIVPVFGVLLGLLSAVAADATPIEHPVPVEETLTAPDTLSAQMLARLQGVEVEDMSQRTESSRTFAGPDGAWRSEQYSGPNWVQVAGDGTRESDWALVDGTLVKEVDGIAPVAHPNDIWLSPGGNGPGTIARLTNAETGVTLEMNWPGDLPKAKVKGNRAVYKDILKGVDLVVEVTATGLEQYLIVHKRSDALAGIAVPLEFVATGATARVTDDGGFVFELEDGTVVFESGEAAAWDAATDENAAEPILGTVDAVESASGLSEKETGRAPQEFNRERATELKVKPTAVGNRVEVLLDVPAEWAASPETQYPIIIDPAVNDALSSSFDTLVSTNYTSDRSSLTELTIGTWDSGVSKTRTFINFNTAELNGRQVVSAQLRLFDYHSWSCNARAWDIYATGTASTATRWTAQPTWGAEYASSTQTKGYSTSCPDGYVYADVTSLVQYWSQAPGTTRGMGIRAGSETDNYYWKRFYSGNHATTSYRPYLSYTWTSVPSTPTGVLVNDVEPLGSDPYYTNDTTPELSIASVDPDGDGVYGLFTVTEGSTVIASDAPGTTANPSRYTTPTLENEGVYSISVTATDGTNTTPAFAPTWTLAVDTVPPSTVTIASSSITDGTWLSGPVASVDLNLSATDAIKFEYSLDGGSALVVPATDGSTDLALLNPTAGEHTVSLRAIDRAGNTSVLTPRFSPSAWARVCRLRSPTQNPRPTSTSWHRRPQA